MVREANDDIEDNSNVIEVRIEKKIVVSDHGNDVDATSKENQTNPIHNILEVADAVDDTNLHQTFELVEEDPHPPKEPTNFRRTDNLPTYLAVPVDSKKVTDNGTYPYLSGTV